MTTIKQGVLLLFMFVVILLMILVWFVPVILAFWEWDFLYIFLYVVWWIPAMIFTIVCKALIDLTGELA